MTERNERSRRIRTTLTIQTFVVEEPNIVLSPCARQRFATISITSAADVTDVDQSGVV